MSANEELRLPACISCKTPIIPGEKGVSFPCPNCGEIILWRCWRCRSTANSYKCPKCGFEGP